MEFLIGIAGIIFIVLVRYRPWIDITREGDVLLWYNGKCKREYKQLFNIYSLKK